MQVLRLCCAPLRVTNLCHGFGDKTLVAEAVDEPEEQAEEDAEQDRGCEGDGDRPVAAAPGEVSGEMAEGEIEASESEDKEADDDEGETEKDEDAAEIGHGLRRLGGGQHGGSFAKKFRRLAGLGEDTDGTGQFVRLLTHLLEVGVERGEDDDAAGREFTGDIAYEGKAVAAGHGDVAEQKMRIKFAGALECLIRGVGSPGIEATLCEDEGKCVGDQTVIVNDKNSLHGFLLSWRLQSNEFVFAGFRLG